MRAAGTFKVVAFTPTEPPPEPAVATGGPVGVATMEKRYQGEVEGRSATLFTAAFGEAHGVGGYVAVESFEGSVGGVRGAFDFAHPAASAGAGSAGEYFTILPDSGSGALSAIRGTGGMAIGPDGTHRIWFDYALD